MTVRGSINRSVVGRCAKQVRKAVSRRLEALLRYVPSDLPPSGEEIHHINEQCRKDIRVGDVTPGGIDVVKPDK